jgi:hypothetical protein
MSKLAWWALAFLGFILWVAALWVLGAYLGIMGLGFGP